MAGGGGTVELDLGGRTGTHYRTSPDGETWSDWTRLRSVPTVAAPQAEGNHPVFTQLRNGAGLKSPVFSTSVVVDSTPPELTQPSVSLRTGALGEAEAMVPVEVRWDARDRTAGLAEARVSVSCGEGQRQRTEAPGQSEPGELVTWEAGAWLFTGAGCEVTANALDGAGNSDRATVAVQNVDYLADGNMTATVRGDQAGLVARRGPDGGRAALTLDGEAVALIDLFAPEPGVSEVVHVLDLPDGEHTLSVEPTGTSDPSSSGVAVAVEGFVSLER